MLCLLQNDLVMSAWEWSRFVGSRVILLCLLQNDFVMFAWEWSCYVWYRVILFYNSTKFRNVSRVKEAVYFTGNIADSNVAYRASRKESRPWYCYVCYRVISLCLLYGDLFMFDMQWSCYICYRESCYICKKVTLLCLLQSDLVMFAI